MWAYLKKVSKEESKKMSREAKLEKRIMKVKIKNHDLKM
jgi:hypothetical protein